MNFDLELPAGCPKPNVGDFEGAAYRLVHTDPPAKEDLLTYFELNLLPDADKCQRCSVSLSLTLEQAQILRGLRPYLGQFIASVSLTALHGKVGKPSKFGHMSWWPYHGMRDPAYLKVVVE